MFSLNIWFLGGFLQTAQTWANAEFCRISESTTGYTFTGYFTSPGIDIRWKGPPTFSVSSERHRQMWGKRNCLSFETAVGGIEPPSPRLTVRRSVARPPLPTYCELGISVSRYRTRDRVEQSNEVCIQTERERTVFVKTIPLLL